MANLERVAVALERFGLPASYSEAARGLGERDVLFFGAAPNRVDILRALSEVTFEGARSRAVEVDFGLTRPVRVIGLDDLIVTKRAAGRPQDLADVARLESIRKRLAGKER